MATSLECWWTTKDNGNHWKTSDCFACAREAKSFKFRLLELKHIEKFFKNDAKEQIEKGLEFTRAFIEEMDFPISINYDKNSNTVSFESTDESVEWTYPSMVVFRTFVWDLERNEILNKAFYELWKEGNTPSASILKSLIFTGHSTYHFSDLAIYDVEKFNDLTQLEKKEVFRKAHISNSTPTALKDFTECCMYLTPFSMEIEFDIAGVEESYNQKYERFLTEITNRNNLVVSLNVKEYLKKYKDVYMATSYLMNTIISNISDETIVLEGNSWYASSFNTVTNDFLKKQPTNQPLTIFRFREIKDYAKVITIDEALEQNLIPEINYNRIVEARFNSTKRKRQLI